MANRRPSSAGPNPAVLDRLLEIYGVATDTALATKMELARSTVGSWRKRGVPYDICVKTARERQLSLEWLLEGTGAREITSEQAAAQDLMARDVLLGDATAYSERFKPGAMKAALDKAVAEAPAGTLPAVVPMIELERMQDCIQVLLEMANAKRMKLKPNKFARACVLLYELSLQAGGKPALKSVERLIETME